MILECIGGILSSLGFAILFNIKGKNLIFATLIGGMGAISYYMSLTIGYSQVISLFIASILISILSEIFARINKCPVTTFLLCALIPLVPGGGMYHTMLEVVRNNIDSAVSIGLETIIQACSIVIGCTLVSSCLRMINQFRRSKHYKKHSLH